MRRTVFTLAAIACLGLAVAPASAQLVPIAENHYLVYNVEQRIPLPPVGPLTFRDQWGIIDYPGPLEQLKWGNPLFNKNGEQVLYDPRIHHSWNYLVDPVPTAPKEIIATHQFGSYNLTVHDAIFLITPADKDFQIPPPEDWPTWANHYLCYMVWAGEPLVTPLFMDDQWGPHSNTALDPYCFCNPVEKILPDGTAWPIVDPEAHLTCYLIDPIPTGRPFVYDDQFLRGVTQVASTECLICFPSFKDEALPTEETNWGRIKALFGEEN